MSTEPAKTTGASVPIVCIGASAGGLEVCRALVDVLPGDLQAAIILILHLDPTHDSMMAELLADHTEMPVVQASDGMPLQPGRLHILPPGVFMTVKHQTIQLHKPGKGTSVRQPFDRLLESLADNPAPLAVVILSGTGTDGSLGLVAAKKMGALIIAQDPAEAAFTGMPDSAIGTGLVDQVLKVADMPAALARLDRTDAARAIQIGAQDAIIALVSKHAAQDISLYKTGTIHRRIARRMALAGCAPHETERYLKRLEEDQQELASLTSDLLIHVTSFFRDPAMLDRLFEPSALPELLADLPPGQPLRVWVAGCSTGEEAYSLAMICLEAIEAAGSDAGLLVLASDIDPSAVATAREGVYPPSISADVTPARLARFFVPDNGAWRVTPALRNAVVFTVADLLTDPPFFRIDLLSCRNVLIYLEPKAQRRVIGLCCFALRPGGLLLLGAAETPGLDEGRFASVDKAARLWKRVGQSKAGDLHLLPGLRVQPQNLPLAPAGRRIALAELCRQVVLDSHAPAAVLMNRKLECLYFLGPTERYLTVTEGHHDPGFLGILPKPLRSRLRLAASSCDMANPVVRITGPRKDGAVPFDIELRALTSDGEPLLLACFLDVAPTVASIGGESGEPNNTARIAELEAEVEVARRDLEQELEVHGADAAEALSVNEELQSANEELLASKEELQSLNEELTALNSQLQETLERHRTTANDLQNVLFSTDVATLFLDIDLNIRFFTPAARAIFRVIPTDVGRPLADLAGLSDDVMLLQDAMQVVATSEPQEREISGVADLWFLRRIQPYRTDGGKVEGVVITFLDISERKRTNAALVAAMRDADRATQSKSRFLAAASHDLRQPLQSLALLHKLMAGDKRPAEVARLSALLDTTLNTMTEMLDSLLDVNRIESGMIVPAIDSVPLAPLMTRLGNEFRHLAATKGLKLTVVASTKWVTTDPQLLEQILRNLLSNAVKYTAAGGIVLGCRNRGGKVLIEIWDSGTGIGAGDLGAIFEAYHQLDTSVARQGLGLGLSIVQRLAALLEHEITVQSRLGQGSVFTIALPKAARADDVEMSVETAPAPLPERHARILLIEDDGEVRSLMAEMLQEQGHQVIAFHSAKEAWEWAVSTPTQPDIVLTDYNLPGEGSGLAQAEKLQKQFGTALPCIILSGDITSETQKRIAASPFTQLAKPVAPERLIATIAALLGSDAEREPIAAPAHPLQSAEREAAVHIVDDDPLVRDTTRRLFEAEGWAAKTYPSAEEFLAAARPPPGDCLITDAVLPGMDGVTMLRELRVEGTMLPAIVLTGHGDTAMAVAAFKAGASDLLEKPSTAVNLLASVRQALKNARDDRARTVARREARKQLADLTARELDVLAKVLEGAPNKLIALALGINQRTVENHRAAVMRKTGAASLPALVRLALAAGLEAG